MPLVSIVVPAYNHARFVGEAIESVLSQTEPDVELIVLDDGSTDGTRDVLARFGSRLRWESHPNMGQAATLNKGWRLAGGRFLGYLSADDALHPEAVRLVLESLLASPGAVAAYPDFRLVDDLSRPVATVRTPEFSHEDLVLRAVCAPGPGALFRRSAYEAAGGWDPAYRRVPDFEFWLRLANLGPFRRVPAVLAYYRVHAGAQSFSPVAPDRADEVVRAIASALDDPGLPGPIRARRSRAQANALVHAARLHLMSGRLREGIMRVRQAAAADLPTVLGPGSLRLVAGGLWRRVRS